MAYRRRKKSYKSSRRKRKRGYIAKQKRSARLAKRGGIRL